MSLLDRIRALAQLTLQDPRQAARVLLAENVPIPARTAGLLLVAVVSALLASLQVGSEPQKLDPLSAFMLASPFRAAVMQWLFLALSVVLIHRVGRAFGGRGSFADCHFGGRGVKAATGGEELNVLGQREIERGALVDLAFRPHAAAMALDDAADVGKADAGALEEIVRMQALEDAEQFLRVPHVEADTVVAHAEDPFIRGRAGLARDFDDGGVACAGVFERVREKVENRLAERGMIGLDAGQRADLPLDGAILEVGLQAGSHFVDQTGKGDGRDPEFRPRIAREVRMSSISSPMRTADCWMVSR